MYDKFLKPRQSFRIILYSLYAVRCMYIYFFYLAQRPNAGHGLLIHEVSWSHTMTRHSRYDSSGRVISSSQRPLPDTTQHSQQTDIHAPVGFEPIISAGERPQTHVLDRAATGNGRCVYIYTHKLHKTYKTWSGKINKKPRDNSECRVPRISFQMQFWARMPQVRQSCGRRTNGILSWKRHENISKKEMKAVW